MLILYGSYAFALQAREWKYCRIVEMSDPRVCMKKITLMLVA